MKKFIMAGVCVLALCGGGFALAQVIGPNQKAGVDSQAGPKDDEDDVTGFTDRRGPPGGSGEPAGDGHDGDPPIIHDGEVSPTGGIAMPHLRPGLWEVTNDVGLTSSVCLDMAIQQEVNIYGSQLHSPFCQAPTAVRREGGERWTYTNVCSVPDLMTMQVEGVIEGDLRTRYRHTMNTRSNGIMGVSDSSSSTESGRYLGPCPANMASGDIAMGGSVVMNMRHAMALGQAMMPGAFGGMPEGFVADPD